MWRLLLLLCSGIVLFAGREASAAVYTCPDGKGGTVFQDRPCTGEHYAALLGERQRDASQPGAGTITGRIGLVLQNGEVMSGTKTEVFLVTRPLKLPPGLTPIYHAYLAIASAIQTKDYIKQIRETDVDGHFNFVNVEHGMYFLMALTNIGRTHVFWQVPVMLEQTNVTLDLSNDNLAIIE